MGVEGQWKGVDEKWTGLDGQWKDNGRAGGRTWPSSIGMNMAARFFMMTSTITAQVAKVSVEGQWKAMEGRVLGREIAPS